MLTFMSVALLIYGSMHLYAFGKVWMAFPHSSGLALTLILSGIVLTFSPFIVWYIERLGWNGATSIVAWLSYIWMGFLFLFFCICLTVDMAQALTSLSGYKWPLNDTLVFYAICTMALTAVGYGLLEARQIRIEQVNITTSKLASGRISIAQISDLHLGRMSGEAFLGRILSKLRELNPDIVVATGDIVDGEGDGLDAMAQQLKSLSPPLGAYAVIGNHEHYAGLDHSLRFLRNAGYTVLRGESAVVGGIVLVGVDDPGALPPDRQIRLDTLSTRRALATVTADNYVVLLKHQPVVDADATFDLQLSGHVHGGQIFPFAFLTRLFYRMHTGLTQLPDGRLLYVSRGAGTWGPPIRLFAPPEITLITIEARLH